MNRKKTLSEMIYEMKRRKFNPSNELKGGNEIMETKSRYEVIADLEKRKRDLIRERDSFKDGVQEREKAIKNIKRELEDEEELLEHMKETQEAKKETIEELIRGIEESLQRFGKLQNKS